jgi:hypothetical protein
MGHHGLTMWVRAFDYAFATAGLAGHAALLIILVRRRLATRLPLFFALIAFYFLRSAIFLAPRFGARELSLYWLLLFLDPGLQLLVIVALARRTWQTLPRLKRHLPALAAAILLFLAIAGITAWQIGPSSHFSPQTLTLKLSIFVSALWLLVTGALIFWLRNDSSENKRLTLIISLGFAAYSAVNIVVEIGHMHFGYLRQATPYMALTYLRLLVYLSCLLLWSIFFAREGTAVARPREQMT